MQVDQIDYVQWNDINVITYLNLEVSEVSVFATIVIILCFVTFKIIIYNNMNKSLILLAIGSMLAAAISFLRLTQYRKKHRRKKDNKKQKQQNKQQKITTTSTSLAERKQQRLITEVDEEQKIRELYENEVITKNGGKLIVRRPILCNHIQQVSYSILLNLNKSKVYEGIVKIKIGSRRDCLNQEDLYIEYRGNYIHYLAINNKKVEEGQIKFDNHLICIQKQLLLPEENNIQIIFSNNYSFLGEGLTSYFPLDKNNKYSLKGQVIYTSNGFYKVSKIFPCLNILNQCEVRLEVLHPNGFHAQSNSLKMQSKMVVKKDYPLYPFLFEASLNSSLNSSRRLNNSGTSETTIKSSDEIIKVKSEFSTVILSSIHNFFVFCSAIVELRPHKNLSLSRRNLIEQKKSGLKQILLRYFFKEHMVKKATSFLNILETQIQEILQKLEQYRSTQKIIGKIQGKIDIFFVNDLDSEGNFYPGAIIMSQNSVERGFIDRRLHYLLSRAFVGIELLTKKKNILTYQQICKLNQLTTQIFPECSDYLYVKNIEYGYIKQQYEKIDQLQVETNNKAQQEVENLSQIKLYWITEFFNKESKYLIMDDSSQYMKKVTPNVRNIISNLHNFDPQDFWTFFFSKYPFLQSNVTQIIISISLKLKGVPTNQAQLKFAQEHFIKSKHYLKFFPHRQIQSGIKKFLELKSYGLEKVLPFIKIKQSCLSMIPAEMEPFLPARQNRFECQKLYEQFKKFNEQKNFHHKTALNRQIQRIRLFLGANLQDERIDISCGLSGWKLLSKLKILPRNQENYQIVYWLSNIPDKFELREQNMSIYKEWREDTVNSIEDSKPNSIEEKTMTQSNNSINIRQDINVRQEMEYEAEYRRQRKESESRLLEEVRQVETLLEIETRDENI